MAEKPISELDSIYSDTNYFINAIVSDYGFYSDFIGAVKSGSAELEVKRKRLKKTVDISWVDTIEQALPALDTVVRSPSKEIIEQEQVLPIELSHNITSRSLRHLAQHTDYINKIEDGIITPSKILNVFHEESIMTYENKFVNTLIRQLYLFVNKRYTQIKKNGMDETNIWMDFNTVFVFGKSKGTIRFNMEVSDEGAVGEAASVGARIEKLNAVVTQYMESPFVKAMGNNYIRPPVLRTNAITKNKDLKQCLMLWEFIETYEKIGFDIDVRETVEKPNPEYINDLYAMISLQYMMFKYNLENDFSKRSDILAQKSTAKPIAPKFRSKIREIEAEDYNVYDSEYRRVIPVSQLGRHKLSADEVKIREAIDAALAADKAVEKIQKSNEREQRRLRAEEDKRLKKEQKRRIKDNR